MIDIEENGLLLEQLFDETIRDCSPVICGSAFDAARTQSFEELKILVETTRVPTECKGDLRRAIVTSLDTHMTDLTDEDMYTLCHHSYTRFKEMAMLVEDKDEISSLEKRTSLTVI
jgi:hypothetical protein